MLQRSTVTVRWLLMVSLSGGCSSREAAVTDALPTPSHATSVEVSTQTVQVLAAREPTLSQRLGMQAVPWVDQRTTQHRCRPRCRCCAFLRRFDFWADLPVISLKPGSELIR